VTDYEHDDRQRWVAEAPKRASRSDFARDRARILHSAAWRRLAARTQVMEAGRADFPRTRMTHSLECAQVGRELGAYLGADPDLVEAACLAHDLGHPPFGHNGERALDEAVAHIGGFEGNAQTLRILTRLEPKAFGSINGRFRSVGVNLTRATLDATIKYPWERHPDNPKFGVYAADRDVFDWVRGDSPPRRRCFEAQIMDWADDVAYSVHDVEDGIHAGLIDLRALRDTGVAAQVCQQAQMLYAPGAEIDELIAAFDRLRPGFPFSFCANMRDLALLKNLTSALIGRFSEAAATATLSANEPPLTRYNAILAVPGRVRLEVAVLKAIAHHFVMTRGEALKAQQRQREVLTELLGRMHATAPQSLAPEFRQAWNDALDDAQALRVVVDAVSSLTDTSVHALVPQLP
jgi:dGTPase